MTYGGEMRMKMNMYGDDDEDNSDFDDNEY